VNTGAYNKAVADIQKAGGEKLIEAIMLMQKLKIRVPQSA
jgi:hypothetical protein